MRVALHNPADYTDSYRLSIGEVSALVATIGTAGLVDSLLCEGAFTGYAPTNEAFASLTESTVKEFLKQEKNDNWNAILTYPVVSG